MKLCLTLIIVLLTVSLNEGEVTKRNIPKDYEYKEPEKIILYPLYDSGVIVDHVEVEAIGHARVVDKYYNRVKALIDAACAEGVNITINSGYRTFEDQLRIRKKYVRNKHCADDTVYLLTAPSGEFRPETGRPGHSRHHSGIAYDFNTKNPDVYKWLKINALKYGFVRTVPEERWHWEYLPNTCDAHHYVEKNHWSWKISYRINKTYAKR